MTTDIHLPLELAVLLCACFAVAGVWTGQARAKSKLEPRRNPLDELLKAENLGKAVDLAARRSALRAGSQAVLHGRIDQVAALGHSWDSDTHHQVRAHVAAVMRAGLRRDDSIAAAEGESFTITLSGADERAAVRIADRLRRMLGQLRLPQIGGDARLTASFGVAAQCFGDGDDGAETRARRALDVALAKGTDRVVSASEVEGALLLPAPAHSQPAASAA